MLSIRDITHDRTYWERLGALPSAIRALVMADDSVPYVKYWTDRTKNGPTLAHARLHHLRRMIHDMREHGFDPEHWRSDARQWDPLMQGFGPIMVVRDETNDITWPRDGSHRASILRALGQPVMAQVWIPPLT